MPTEQIAAQSYLNYRGDVTADLRVGQRHGPTTYGGIMYVVGWDYDPDHEWPTPPRPWWKFWAARPSPRRGRTSVGMSAVNPLPRSAH